MLLKEIYSPIQQELINVERILENCLKNTKHKSILKMSDYLLDSRGKRLRPILAILCARASGGQKSQPINHQLIKIGTALELIHTASLIHDDIIDHARLRHNKPTINCRYGSDASIALGDYLYSIAFQLISGCGNTDILECISSATKSMCEGELLQVLERDNLDLLKQRYLLIVKKKTALLFAASCQAGAMLFDCSRAVQDMLKEYGLNFGIAFQIADDCLDLIGKKEKLGKSPGADFRMGELTLPVLNLLSKNKDKNLIISLIRQPDKQDVFKEIRQRFINSEAFIKTKEDACHYIRRAKRSIDKLNESCFKKSLFALADYAVERL